MKAKNKKKVKIKNKFNSIFPLSFSIIVIVINTLLWKKINLTYANPGEVFGVYSLNNHHVFNDTLRYLIYITVPLLSFLYLSIALNKDNFKSLTEIFISKRTKSINSKQFYSNYLVLILILIIITIDFLLVDFPIQKLDIFHEGQLLSGALNYIQKEQLWTGTYVNTSIFYDLINTKLAFQIMDVKSIGAYRFHQLFLNFITSIVLVFFSFIISKKLNFKKENELIFFVFLSLFCFYLVTNGTIYYRHIPIFIFLILIVKILFDNKVQKLFCLLLGSLSILSLLWSIDVGAYINATLLVTIIIFFLQKKINYCVYIVWGIFISWILFGMSVGAIEFREFINNSLSIFKYNEYYNGLIHPQPFSEDKNSTRATKALIINLINGFLLIKLLFGKKNNIQQNLIWFLVIFYILAFFNYKTALSRSDGGHIDLGGSLNLLLIFILILYIFLNKVRVFEKKQTYNSRLIISLFLIVIFSFSAKFFLVDKRSSIDNLISFKSRYKSYINHEDSFYFQKDYINLANYLKKLLINEECFQVFNYEPTIFYLINKRSCTKYFLIMSIGSKMDQNKFVKELMFFKPKYILEGGPFDGWGHPPNKRFPIVNKYIRENYHLFKEISSRKILRINSLNEK